MQLRMFLTSMFFASLIAEVLCVGFSFVASPNYAALVSLALLFGIVHCGFGLAFVLRCRSRFRWLLGAVSLPVAAFSIDNLGRMLGLPAFRILI